MRAFALRTYGWASSRAFANRRDVRRDWPFSDQRRAHAFHHHSKSSRSGKIILEARRVTRDAVFESVRVRDNGTWMQVQISEHGINPARGKPTLPFPEDGHVGVGRACFPRRTCPSLFLFNLHAVQFSPSSRPIMWKTAKNLRARAHAHTRAHQRRDRQGGR